MSPLHPCISMDRAGRELALRAPISAGPPQFYKRAGYEKTLNALVADTPHADIDLESLIRTVGGRRPIYSRRSARSSAASAVFETCS